MERWPSGRNVEHTVMRKLAVLSAVALVGLGSFSAPQAQARDGRNAGMIAAGVIGGLAAGALLGAGANASAAPRGVTAYGGGGYGSGFGGGYGGVGAYPSAATAR